MFRLLISRNHPAFSKLAVLGYVHGPGIDCSEQDCSTCEPYRAMERERRQEEAEEMAKWTNWFLGYPKMEGL